MTKNEARHYFLEKRQFLSENDIQKASFQIYNHWLNSKLAHLDSYHIFLSIKEKKEINTYPFIHFLWEKNKKIYTSKIEKDHLLHFEFTPDTILKKNKWNIPEPINQKNISLPSLDCIFIPLLACDLSGNRVGYGKGYYDRFLTNFPDAKKIGLSFFDPIIQIENILPTDILLDYILTPNYLSQFPMKFQDLQLKKNKT